MKMKSILCLFVLGIALCNVNALTREELDKIQASMLTFIKECSKEYGVSDDELKAVKESGNIEGVEPCLIGCVFRRAGFIDGDGKFLTEKVKELSKKYLSNEEDQNKFDSIADSCASEDAAPEGDPACSRSKQVFQCFAKHRGELNITS
uniref:Putative odorant binding protein 7 n=1 Tax=Corcyra cephalonica TaxID=139036 RepID=A0A8K1UB63_CORCP|nr:putative odorant binding protein 7 [Corcyra cephalonica]